jgi:hypothetical protein
LLFLFSFLAHFPPSIPGLAKGRVSAQHPRPFRDCDGRAPGPADGRRARLRAHPRGAVAASDRVLDATPSDHHRLERHKALQESLSPLPRFSTAFRPFFVFSFAPLFRTVSFFQLPSPFSPSFWSLESHVAADLLGAMSHLPSRRLSASPDFLQALSTESCH